MNSYVTFKVLRIIQIILIVLCAFLEIVEYSSFLEFYEKQGYSISAYFNARITKSTITDDVYFNGVKILYYMVIILSILDSGFYVIRLHKGGPFKRDITVSAFFMALWLISGIANIFPIFKGKKYICNEPAKSIARIRECEMNVMSISIGWINAFLFSLTTLVALRFWKKRQEMYVGESRVKALGEVVYKYKPRPNTIVQLNEPEQVLIYKTCKSLNA
ncbi:19720_t:CDS:2 [Funneliformis geosporum]|uniref:13826_t:CDS:1 n=1 Tax=Funneliformis geosporum TaxID=1117311 RepID=A0A9W4SB28_9GLOM|nr:13826_t:CDS:2 [Funneliformis geosporum]CAI2162953.1 19720_t:CDS:2 [Funneliformis geosporum]